MKFSFHSSFTYAIEVFFFVSSETLSDGLKRIMSKKTEQRRRKTLFRFLDFMTGTFGKHSLAQSGKEGEK